MKRINVYLEEGTIEHISALAQERGIKPAEALREALALGLGLYEAKGASADVSSPAIVERLDKLEAVISDLITTVNRMKSNE